MRCVWPGTTRPDATKLGYQDSTDPVRIGALIKPEPQLDHLQDTP
jgi:hypothetical protein